ncbi:MAG: orotidine-5'-phosphate decarboxylase [Alphaproteobacteria bacterium]|nr:orotidine-5'-phosphate decarboxylase [Alphaproteobacteria bacterium]
MIFFEQVKQRQDDLKTKICLGLDPRPNDVADGKWTGWGRRLIDETADYICCIKPNMAFYQAGGLEGLKGLEETIEYSRSLGIPVLLDQKVGDIGSTAEAYAKGIFEWLKADCVTASPYMGSDSINPFLKYEYKCVFTLCCTSNKSGEELQHVELADGEPLYIHTAKKAKEWGNRVGLVIGATQPDAVAKVRKVSDAWLLLPGLGAQGGDVEKTTVAAATNFIFPVSRGISHVENPKESAKKFAEEVEAILAG